MTSTRLGLASSPPEVWPAVGWLGCFTDSTVWIRSTCAPSDETCFRPTGWSRLMASRVAGTRRIREVLARRPDGAPATESLLETLFIQLAREVDGLPEPTRQHEVYDRHGNLIARVDICWPDIGLFIELDGQQHQGQPVYDARRETAVVAVTGWLPGRFTWRETVTLRRTTKRRLADLATQARRRRR